MNSSSPLIPQGSNLEQQNKARTSLKFKIFIAIGVNVVVLLVLLMQGCKREQPKPVVDPVDAGVFTDTNPPPLVTDTNFVATQTDSNAVAQPQPQPPIQEPVVPLAPAASATEYKIVAGDSFYTIGKKFGVSAKALQAANPTVDPAKLKIGKTIQIPAPTTVAPASSGSTPVVDAASGETTYAVKSGDSLSKIATQFHTTIAAIKSANNLATDRIKVGDKLKIPAKTKTP